MYLIRRVFRVKPGTTRKAARIIADIGRGFEDAGQRSPTRVYMSGTTVPGPANTVYMDWTEQALQSPYRKENKTPDGVRELYKQLGEFQEESYIEFYELLKPSPDDGE